MKFRDLSLIGMVGLVVVTLQLLARVNKPPEMPRDFPHSVVSGNVREQCLRYHQRIEQQTAEVAAIAAMAMVDAPHQQPKQWRADKSDCLLCHRPASRTE